MRLIDADKAFEVLTEVYHHKTEAQHMALKEALDRVTTIEAEPVRRGRWQRIDGQSHIMECSECGSLSVENRYNYCPNCGARMDLEGEDHEQD